ncbi:MAG: sulfotransferase [Gammaproteobacteria bacterium]
MNASPATAASPDDAYRGEWQRFEAEPGPLLFLLGCQRSGTTWLHLQLARSRAFRFLSAWDVQNFDALVHARRSGSESAQREAFAAMLRAAAQDRGIDTIPADADTPEEYGLVIGDGTLRYDRPDTNIDTLPRLRALCAKKALLDGRTQPLLLKSPPDYPDAVPLLRATWPGARFIAIQRHPLRTLQSQVLAWRALALRRNPYLAVVDAGYRALFDDKQRRLHFGLHLHSRAGIEWLAGCILRAHMNFMQMQDQWRDASTLLVLRYEDLCADQAAGFAQVSRFTGTALPPPAQAPAPRETALLPEVREVFAAHRAAFAPYLQRFDYDEELPA